MSTDKSGLTDKINQFMAVIGQCNNLPLFYFIFIARFLFAYAHFHFMIDTKFLLTCPSIYTVVNFLTQHQRPNDIFIDPWQNFGEKLYGNNNGRDCA